MAQRRDDAGDGAARERTGGRGTVFAALAGTLIGAVAGLTGSLLGYLEAKDTHRSEADARRADIRRTAYVELAASISKYEQQATQLLNVSLDPARTAEEERRQFEDKYAPANTDLSRAITTVRLVAPKDARRDLEELEARSARVGELASNWYGKGPEGVDLRKVEAEFDEATKRQLASLQEFMDKAADQAL
ncbi:hypothetical protein ACFWP3_05360 [Streptomyces sp. NPDC058525]|uniref:hypothetical protein n=1 Tax=Streptomyces sp. NPDC058525 TaxID=3346538 RepID=UPI003657BBB0